MLTDIMFINLSVVFCRINTGLKSAGDGHHFSGKSNRFWKVFTQNFTWRFRNNVNFLFYN